MSEQYLCFYDSGRTGDEEEDRVPVGYGRTRREAFAMGIRNALPLLAGTGVWGMRMGGFATVRQPDLTAADFAEVAGIIDKTFGKDAPGAETPVSPRRAGKPE